MRLTSLSFFVIFVLLEISSTVISHAQTYRTNSPRVETRVGNPQSTRQTPPSYPSDLRQAIIDEFGITFDGFDNQYLRWYWEKFWDIRQTNLLPLVKGSVIQKSDARFSQQIGCPGSSVALSLGQYQGEEFNKLILIHELAHIIQNCQPSSKSFFSELPGIIKNEGYITGYSRNASSCAGSIPLNEDYAETLAYYLNPNSTSRTLPCGDTDLSNPYKNRAFSQHFELANKILGAY